MHNRFDGIVRGRGSHLPAWMAQGDVFTCTGVGKPPSMDDHSYYTMAEEFRR